MMWKVVFTKQAQSDACRLQRAGLRSKTEQILAILGHNPFQNPPPYEKLVGDLTGFHSRRINIQHRMVYQVYREQKIVKVVRMWTHYE